MRAWLGGPGRVGRGESFSHPAASGRASTSTARATAPFFSVLARCLAQYASAATAVRFQSPPGARPEAQDAASGDPQCPLKAGPFPLLKASRMHVLGGVVPSQPAGSWQ